ncbi:MAG: exosome complex protein Rrp42 [Candidatus Altiarchaeota archaeon]|nr:exosome complex protein Rrp42 [Candidatus Altiarchaeota archaeon]
MNIEHYLRKDYVTKITSEGRRLDARSDEDFRPVRITKDYVEGKADGSAYVELGNTKVLAGVSVEVGTPYPDSPHSGILSTSVEFRPIASPDFEIGPPREESIEVARVVDRGIRESGMIDLDSLSIDDEKVWAVFVDIHMLDHDGNLFDASTLAAVTALLNARLPKCEEGRIVGGEYQGKLPTRCTPISCTSAKIAGRMLLDPCLDEEYAMDTRLTVTTTDTVNAMQKGGSGSLKMEEIEKAVDLAFRKSAELRKLVEGA